MLFYRLANEHAKYNYDRCLQSALHYPDKHWIGVLFSLRLLFVAVLVI